MKKKIYGGIAVVAIAVAVAFNVNLITKKTSIVSNLMLTNVEMLAQAEPGDYTETGKSTDGKNGGENYGWEWWTQGATKDEWQREFECEISSTSKTSDPNINGSVNLTYDVNGVPIGVSGGYNSGGTTTTTNVKTGGTKIECFDGGKINCSEKDC